MWIEANARAAIDNAVVLSADADLSSENPEIAARGEDVIARSLETARELGSSSVSGLTYAGLGRYTAPPTQGQRDRVIEALGRLDKKARSLGVRLGIEPINRYETYMVNTIAEAAAIVTAVGSDNLFVHLDTYHMNIEENDVAGAVTKHGQLIGYVHLADNNRAMPGTGTFDFKALFRALAGADYRGAFALYVGVSSYTAEQMARAAAILRDLGTPCLIHQPSYSMLNRFVESDRLLGQLEHDGVGCMAFSPLAQGLLTDRYLNGVPADSRAAMGKPWWRDGFLSADKLSAFAALNVLAGKRGQSLAQMAVVGFCATGG